MRLFTVLAFTTLLSAPAFAADLGTYRPGTPYSSTVAGGADVCESHCSGDAQCRGWNYVKPNPRAAGVCEFMSQVGAPISSAISISGAGLSVPSYGDRIAPGGSNTIRVGTSPAPQGQTVRVGATPSGRRIVREPVPQQQMPQQQDMSLTAQQNRFRQPAAPQATPQGRPAAPARMQQPAAFRPMLDAGQPVLRQPQTQRPMMDTRRVDPRAAAPRQQRTRMTGPRRAAPQMQAPQYPQAHQRPVMPPQQAMMQRRPVAAPQAQAPQSMPPQMQAAPAQIALSPAQAQRSLFGSLNDDLKAPVSPEATPSDAPIATAVPSVPVSAQPLEALAGGR